MKNLMVGLGILFIIALGGYVFFAQNRESPTMTPSSVASPTSPVVIAPSVTSTVTNDLMRGGSSFKDPTGLYVFLYPNDFTIDTQNNGQYTRIYKRGATQQGQTEMYDGILMVFESIDLGSQTLEKWVDDYIRTTTADGTIKLIEPKKMIAINSYPGFTYTANGLGTSIYLFLQKDPGSKYAVGITTAVHDPEKKNYQKEVDAVLSTLKLLK